MKLTIIVLFSMLLVACGETEKTPASKLMDAGYRAIASCDKQAKEQIKYPLTAKFENGCKIDYTDDSTGVVILRKGQCTNGFGVPMGFHYVALVQRIGIDTFKLMKFNLTQE